MNKFFIISAFFVCTLITLKTHINGAASSSSSAQTTVPVIINDKGHALNKSILLQIPYFQVLLAPAEIGKTYYEIDSNYLDLSDQENMAKLPQIRLFEKIVDFAASSPQIKLILDEKLHRALIILYNLLHAMKNKQFSDQEIIDQLKQSSLPLEVFYQTIYAFFSNDAVKRAFNQTEIEILKQTIAPSFTGNISQAIFSPAQNMLNVILALIKAEKTAIRVACYLLNSTKIADALVQALQRGVKIQIIVDAQQASGVLHASNLPYCAWSNPINSSPYPPKMHNKFFIFSNNIHNQSILVTGSANCTMSAQNNNWENMIISNNPELFLQFSNRFEYLLQSSDCITPIVPPKMSETKAKNFTRYYSPHTMSLLKIAHTLKKTPSERTKRSRPIDEKTSDELLKYSRHD